MNDPVPQAINVLIPNATSPKNPGDQAMLLVLIRFIKKAHPRASITVHTIDPHLYVNPEVTVKQTLYSWAVFEKPQFLTRIARLSALILTYLSYKTGMDSNVNSQLTDLINDYRQADLIVFAGGGYLRSKKGLFQSLNLLMQLSVFKVAALFHSKKVVGPVSIGPFGYSWQEKLVTNVLQPMDLVSIREDISYENVKGLIPKAIQSADHALLSLEKKGTNKKHSKNLILGITLRKWLEGTQQQNLEDAVLEAIVTCSNKTPLTVQPIIQVDAKEYGEDDESLMKKFAERLIAKNIQVLPLAKIQNMKSAVDVFANLDMLLGMRMHSNVFAAIQGVPFVAISYEHKTEGIAKQLHMEDYCISCINLNTHHLALLLKKVIANKSKLSKQLLNTIQTIKKTENDKWVRYLSIKHL